jgi:hypothetical protein
LFAIGCVVVLVGLSSASVATGLDSASEPDRIIREHNYDTGDGEPNIERQIVGEDGVTYILTEVSDPVPSVGSIPERWFIATVQRPVSPDLESQGMAAVRSVFDDALSLDTGDYAGILRMQSLVTAPVYRSLEQQIERTLVYPDLESEDVLQLPEYADFTVTSDESLEATAMQTLKRVAVSWEVSGLDDDGRPALYEATVVFRGTQRQLIIDYFMTTATYSGLVPATSLRETVFATYESEPLPEPQPLPVIRPVTVPEPAAPLVAPDPVLAPSMMPLILAGIAAVVMLLALLFFLYFFIYRNARLLRVFPNGKRRVLIRKHLRLEAGEAVFKIDPSLTIYREGLSHLIVLGGRLAGRKGYLTALWGDQLILRCTLKRETDITEELIRMLEDGEGFLIQEGLDDADGADDVDGADGADGAGGAGGAPVSQGEEV